MVPASFTSSNRFMYEQQYGIVCGSESISDKNNSNVGRNANEADYQKNIQQQQENSHQQQAYQGILGSQTRMEAENYKNNNSLPSAVPFLSSRLDPKYNVQNHPHISGEQTQISRSYPYPMNQMEQRQTQSTLYGEHNYQLVASGNQHINFNEYFHDQEDLKNIDSQRLNVNDQNRIQPLNPHQEFQQSNQGSHQQANSGCNLQNIFYPNSNKGSSSQQEALHCFPQQYSSPPDIKVLGEDINDQYYYTPSLSFSQNQQTADTAELYPYEPPQSSSKAVLVNQSQTQQQQQQQEYQLYNQGSCKTRLFNKDVNPYLSPHPNQTHEFINYHNTELESFNNVNTYFKKPQPELSRQQQILQQFQGEEEQDKQQYLHNQSRNYYYPQQQNKEQICPDQLQSPGGSIISENYQPIYSQPYYQITEKHEDLPGIERANEKLRQEYEQGIQMSNDQDSRENLLIQKENRQQQQEFQTENTPKFQSISKSELQLQTLLHPKKTIKKSQNLNQQPLDQQQSQPQQKRKYKARKQKPEVAPPQRCEALAIQKQTPSIIIPNLIFQPFDKKKFSLFGDCILDLGLLQVDDEDYKQRVTELFDDSKRVTHIQKVNNGDFLEITLDTFTRPLQDYQFVIDLVKSVSSQEAYKWFKVLSLFQAKCFKQTEFVKSMMRSSENNLDYLKNLFTLRRQAAAAKAQELVKELPRNKYAKYCIYHFDFESQSILLKHVGYSRKMLGIIGLNLQEAPSVFLRKGSLDMYLQKEKAFNMLLSAIQLVDHPKNQIIDQISGETFIHTLDLIKLQANLNIKLVSLTYAFDKANNLNYPFCDDFLAEVIYEIDPENLQKFNEVREQKNIFGRFSTQEIVDGELEDLMDINQFLSKYYATSVYQLQKQNSKQNQERLQLMENIDNQGMEDTERQNSGGQSSSEGSLQQESSKSQQQPQDVCEIKAEDSLLSSNAMQISKANLIAFLDPTYVDFIQNP